MLIFGFLTIRNINRSQRVIQPFVVTTSIITQVIKERRKKIRRSG
jgi:hypothetical protein